MSEPTIPPPSEIDRLVDLLHDVIQSRAILPGGTITPGPATVAACSRVRDFVEGIIRRCHAAEAERDKLQAFKDWAKEVIRYWSYCTWSGIRRECPEKSSEFTELCQSLGIQPYSNGCREKLSSRNVAISGLFFSAMGAVSIV